jgi:hypothetical protein
MRAFKFTIGSDELTTLGRYLSCVVGMLAL